MTKEELEQILGNEETIKSILSHLTANGYVVRNQEEEKTFIENYEKNVLPNKVGEGIGERVKEIATRYEQELLEITGMNKEPNEKYYDFQKRVFKQLTESNGQSKELIDQLNLYKEKVGQLDQALNQERESKKQEILSFKNQSLLDNALTNINIAYPSHLTTDEDKKAYRKTFETMVKNDFISKYKPTDANGEVAYYEGESLLFDTATAKHLTPLDIIKRSYSTFIAPESEPPKGMGSGQQPKAPSVGKMSRTEYFEYADKQGIVTGSKSWYDGYAEVVQE